jgi:hypothetical protein
VMTDWEAKPVKLRRARCCVMPKVYHVWVLRPTNKDTGFSSKFGAGKSEGKQQ